MVESSPLTPAALIEAIQAERTTSPGTYTCEYCGGTFPYEPGWTDDDAAAEYLDVFGDTPDPAGYAVVCDVCYVAMGLGS